MTLHEHKAQEAFSEHKEETQGAFSKLEEEAQGAFLKLKEETPEALLELEEETQEALSEHEQEQQQKEGGTGPTSGPENLEGPALPPLRKLAIGGNLPPILSSRTRSQRPHTGVEGAALHCFLSTIEAEEENGVEDALACDAGGQMAMQATLDIPEPRNRWQAMESAARDGIAGMGRMAEDREDWNAWSGRELRL